MSMLPSSESFGLQSLSKTFLPELHIHFSEDLICSSWTTYMAGSNLIVILLLFFLIKNLACGARTCPFSISSTPASI